MVLVLAKRVTNWYKKNEFGFVIVYGHSGVGKSSYAWKVLFELYPQTEDQTREEYIQSLKRYLVFTPRQLINLGDELEAAGERIPAIILDDGGLHFGKMDYKDPIVNAALKYLQTIRSQVACIILTTTSPSNLVAGMRSLDMNMVKVTKLVRDERIGTGYTYSVGPKGRVWVNRVWEDYFDAHLPNDFFAWYSAYRKTYANVARDKLRVEVQKADAKTARQQKKDAKDMEDDYG